MQRVSCAVVNCVRSAAFEQRSASCTEKFNKHVKQLHADYQAVLAAKDAKIKAIKTPELRLLKTIKSD